MTVTPLSDHNAGEFYRISLSHFRKFFIINKLDILRCKSFTKYAEVEKKAFSFTVFYH